MIGYVSNANTAIPISEPTKVPAAVPYVKYISGAGITEPNSEIINISTSKQGIISVVNVEVGQEVKKGDVLFVIENSEAQAQIMEAKAEVKSMQDQYNIIASVRDYRAISSQEKLEKANALEIAKAKLESANVSLELHNVRSPIDGVILSGNVRAGEFAQSGSLSEPLIRMGNISPMHLRVDIDENDVWRFTSKLKAIAYVRGNNDIQADLDFVRVEPYVRPKKSLTGDSAERVDTRVLQVIYKFDPKNQAIYNGQQMDVYIEN
jgi:multidrug efflux pump subunit AcrA (membrane-fusion protein)